MFARRRSFQTGLFVAVMLVIYLATSAAASAADSAIDRFKLEISGFGAFSFGSGLGATERAEVAGFRQFVTKQNNGELGVQLVTPLFRSLAAYGEWSYAGGGRSSFTQDVYASSPTEASRLTTTASSRSIIYEGGFQVSVPLKRTPQITPYISIGIGGIRKTSETMVDRIPQVLSIDVVDVHTQLVGIPAVGFRYYIRERMGMRAEIKGYSATIGRVAIGLFYQFR